MNPVYVYQHLKKINFSIILLILINLIMFLKLKIFLYNDKKYTYPNRFATPKLSSKKGQLTINYAC